MGALEEPQQHLARLWAGREPAGGQNVSELERIERAKERRGEEAGNGCSSIDRPEELPAALNIGRHHLY